MPCAISLQSISKQFVTKETKHEQLFSKLSCDIATGECITIVGSSGCGKTTLLNIIAGLEQQDEGTVVIQGTERVFAKQRRGCFGYMPQNNLLLPWRNLIDNALLGAELAGVDYTQAFEQAMELLPLFGLEGKEHTSASVLSGGMSRRVALLRTYLTGKDILLLDEPFSALDMFSKKSLHLWLIDLQNKRQKTIFLVTHDIDEAIVLGNKILAFSATTQDWSLQPSINLDTTSIDKLHHNDDFISCKRDLLSFMSD